MKSIFTNDGVSIARLSSLERVVEAGSIALASQRDSNTQSQISRQITELESAMGVQLLDRTKKPYSATDEAKKIADSYRRFVIEIQEVLDLAGGLQRPIAVGAGEVVIREFLIPLIGRSRKGGGQVKWSMQNLKRGKIQEGLSAEWLDIGIASGLISDGNVCVSEISSYGFRLLLPDGEKPDQSGWEKLSRMPLAMLAGDSGFKRFLVGCAGDAGIVLDFAAECTSYAQAVSLAQVAGWGTFVPEYWWSREKSWVKRAQALPGLDGFQRTLQLGWNRKVCERRPEVDRLVKALLKAKN